MIPFVVPGVWPELKPGRLASGFRTSAQGCRVALLGLSDDLGVRLNGGRPGARGGPSAFRAALGRYGVAWDGLHQRALDVPIYDAGDVARAPGEDEAALLATHARVEAAVAALHHQGLISVCVGGGHDLTLPAVTAAARVHGCEFGGINLDAHLDVRERLGSGMAFRRLIAERHVDGRRFAELGLGRFVNDPGDLDWLRAQGGQAIFADDIFEQGLDHAAALDRASSAGPAFLSIDLDALDQSIAPGVSAPNPLGLGLRDAARLAEAAGERAQVQHFDLMELNPELDVDGHTARAAASLFLHFIAGVSRRAT